MKVIQKLVDRIDEELCDAQHYAECYVEEKAASRANWAARFHGMAEDELRHSEIIHQYAVEKIESINKVYQPTAEMQDKWDESHRHYVDHHAWVKHMLEM